VGSAGVWYADKLGGAFGFDSEVSAGASIPPLDDLTRMLSPQELEALWKYPEVRQYHASAAWSTFAKITPFDAALANRYGAPKSLADYVAKSQLDNYDNVRAQFEAFNAHMNAANPSTGVIYWMLNNAWPSLHWHLYDYFLNPAGAYYGAKIANEPVHIQYSYDTRAIMLINHTLTSEHGLRAVIRVRNLDGSVPYERRLQDINLAGIVRGNWRCCRRWPVCRAPTSSSSSSLPQTAGRSAATSIGSPPKPTSSTGHIRTGTSRQ